MLFRGLKPLFLALFAVSSLYSPAWGQIDYGIYPYCAPTTVSGHITYYSLTGPVNCSITTDMFDLNRYAALNEYDYLNSAGCGSCLRIERQDGGGTPTTVMVVDQCPYVGNELYCYSGSHHVDLAQDAYLSISGGLTDNPAVYWKIVECPLALRSKNNAAGNITYMWKYNSQQFWAQICFFDSLFPIQGVRYNATSLNRESYNYWGNDSITDWHTPFTFQITDMRNNVVSITVNDMSVIQSSSNPVSGIFGTTSVQFPGCFPPTNTPTGIWFTSTPTKTATITPTSTVTRTNTTTRTNTATPTGTWFTATPTITFTPTNCGFGTGLDLHWSASTSMPTPNAEFGVGVLNGLLYVVGGRAVSGDPIGALYAFDPVAHTWTPKTPMPTARAGLGAVFVDGILYAIGGTDSADLTDVVATVEAYDPVTDTWSARSPMPTAREGMCLGVVNGKIFVIGGQDGAGITGVVEAYDPATDNWSTGMASMPTPRYQGDSGVLNGLIYTTGGHEGPAYSTALEVYDPMTDSWTAKAPMSTAREHHAVAVMDGFLYAVGGLYNLTDEPMDRVESYDPATDAWTPRVPMPTSRSSMGVGVVDGTLYAIGGVPFSGGSTATNESAHFQCVPFTSTPTPYPTMPLSPTETPFYSSAQVFDDFEDGDLNDNYGGVWTTETQGSCNANASVISMPPMGQGLLFNATDNNYCLLRGSIAPAYQDLRWIDGIFMVLNADSAVSMRLQLDCPADGGVHYTIDFEITPGWNYYSFTKDMLQRSGGPACTLDQALAQCTAILGLSVDPVPYYFAIDQILFFQLPPTPEPTPADAYRNTEAEVAAAMGCSASVVAEVRAYNLTPQAGYLVMRLAALTGQSVASIMALRNNMGWDDICRYHHVAWLDMMNDLKTRIHWLKVEPMTSNRIFRTGAYRLSGIEIESPPHYYPTPPPFLPPFKEVCP